MIPLGGITWAFLWARSTALTRARTVFLRSAAMTNLPEKLIARIRDRGSLRFAEVMAAALYDEEWGYYAKGARIGRRSADFITASELHPLFGRTLAAVVSKLLITCDAYTICEIGAGTGALAQAILEAIRARGGDLARTVTYVISEKSAHMKKVQRERLSEFGGSVEWTPVVEMGPFSGVVLAVELFDALPVHRVVWRRGTLFEEHVEECGGMLRSVWLECADEEIRRHLNALPIPQTDEQIVEVNQAAGSLLRDIGERLAAGYLLVFDYGDASERLYSPDRMEGTLRCFANHSLHADYLGRLGESDITASVDFGSLQRYAEAAGFRAVEFDRQFHWLLRQGIVDAATTLDGEALEVVEKIRVREALKELMLPGRMSDNFRVLVLEKESAA